ncbi:HlyD family type I secretion periplasmic adaptor subunit [Roseobacter denitrificans]|uniref:HlyD family type I secretion periplasmic adaptor subunit n=1 Tax=Roseobacter denitrificans TaxID=2434 RepID=UPI0002E51EA2|nr:HlyD family type I secretion periplasmic adaptor subunit [Roseobacter denitrificans]AVL52549.1 HlyD family type I secretion periplasmic adaptor subunit [Roseobacter denitrificans]SFG29805.1 type I secretion membrane fusion protein, HlyD family [Roseobacter denitrificans OCh 114]
MTQTKLKRGKKGVFAKSDARAARRGPKLASLLILTLVGFLGGSLWMAASTVVPELTRASGALVPTGRYHQIQAPESGTVVSVHVHEGQVVQTGDVLAELSSASLDQLEQNLRQELLAIETKVKNFQAIIAGVTTDNPTTEPLSNPEMEFADTQLQLFESRQRAQKELITRLEETLATLERARKLAEKRVIAKTLSVQKDEDLFNKGLTTSRDLDAQKDRLDQLQARLVDVDVRLSQLQKEVSLSQSSVVQNRLSMEEKYTEKLFELELQREALKGQLETVVQQRDKLKLRSPANGVLHAIGFPNPGEIVNVGDVLFELLPTQQSLVAEIEVNPSDIGHVSTGDPVALKFDTFDPRRYGQVEGEIISISPNSVMDSDTGQEHFRATVALGNASIGEGVWQRDLKSGMTATAEIVTDERTVLAYLLKPISRSLENAFGER